MKMNLDAVFKDGFQHGQDLVNANVFKVRLEESNADLEDFKYELHKLCWESVEAWERYELGVAEGIDFETNVLINRAETEFTAEIIRCVNKLF